MARIKPIRIAENDRKEFARMVKNSKAKIARTKKNYGINLDEKVELPKTIESFTTRKAFNEWKEKTSSFTNRNNLNFQFVKNDYGVVASKKEINEIVRDTKKAQRYADKINKEIMNKPFYLESGEQQGTVGQEMKKMADQTVGLKRPKDFDFESVRNQNRLKRVEKSMKEKSDPKHFSKRLIRMQNNFVDLLAISLNSNADELIDKLKLIPPDDFYNMYMFHKEFDFDLWDSEGQFIGSDEESNGIVNKMMQRVDEYFKGKTDYEDLKGYPPGR